MATNSQIPFNPQGETVAITAAGTAPTGVRAPVKESFAAQESGQVRVINTGSVTVHLGVGPTAAKAQANTVAAVSGNPGPGIPLVPGAVEIMRFPLGSFFSGLASTATTVYITPGTGL